MFVISKLKLAKLSLYTEELKVVGLTIKLANEAVEAQSS